MEVRATTPRCDLPTQGAVNGVATPNRANPILNLTIRKRSPDDESDSDSSLKTERKHAPDKNSDPGPDDRRQKRLSAEGRVDEKLDPSISYALASNTDLNSVPDLSAVWEQADDSQPGSDNEPDYRPDSAYQTDDESDDSTAPVDSMYFPTKYLKDREYRKRISGAPRLQDGNNILQIKNWSIFPADEIYAEQCKNYHKALIAVDGLLDALVPDDAVNILVLGARTAALASEIKKRLKTARVVAIEDSLFSEEHLTPFDESSPYEYQLEDVGIAVSTMRGEAYDFIYLDRKAGLYTRREWDNIYNHMFRILRPGGTMVHAELSWDKLASDSCTAVYWQYYLTICNHWAEMTGQPYRIGSEINNWMTKIGLEDVQQKQSCLPSEAIATDVEGLTRGPFTLSEISERDIGLITFLMGQEATAGECFFSVRHVWGRKPVVSPPSAIPSV